MATSEFDVVPNANRLVLEVHAADCRVDHFLFAHPGHKEELEQQQFLLHAAKNLCNVSCS